VVLSRKGGSHLLPQDAITSDAPADVTGLREQRARGWPGAATRRVLLSAHSRWLWRTREDARRTVDAGAQVAIPFVAM